MKPDVLEHYHVLLQEATEQVLATMEQDRDVALANSTVYLEAFRSVTAGWLWLCQALTAQAVLQSDEELCSQDRNFYQGKLHAARLYMQWELPAIAPSLKLVCDGNTLPFSMRDEWF